MGGGCGWGKDVLGVDGEGVGKGGLLRLCN